MTDPRDRHEDRLIDRELRQVLGGEGPSPELAKQFRARIAATSTGGGARTRSASDRRRRSGRRGRRSSTPLVAAVSVAAALLVTALVWVALQSDESAPAIADPDAPRVVITNESDGNDGSTPPRDDAPAVNDGDGETVDQPRHNAGDSAAPDANRPPRDPDVIEQPDRPGPSDPDATDPADPQDGHDAPGPHVDQPQPDPANPDPADPDSPDPDVVEQPDPQPDDGSDPRTTPDPEPQRPVLATVRAVSRRDRIEARQDDGEWRELQPDAALVAGLTLKTNGRADLTLASGALLRFDGELTLTGTADDITLAVQADDLYIDSLDAPGRVTVTVGDVAARVANAVALIEGHRGWMEVTCVAGTVHAVTADEETAVAPGHVARVRDRGVDVRAADLADVWRSRLLDELPDRVLLRHDFDDAHESIHINTGEIRDGFGHGIHSRGYPVRLEAVFPARQLIGGERVRIRLRFSDATTLGVGVWSDSTRHFTHREEVAAGEWTVVEFALADADRLDQLKFFADGDDRESLSLAIDWFEVIRRPVEH